MSDQRFVDQRSVQPDGLSDPMPNRRPSVAQPPTTVYPDLKSPPYSVTTFSQPQLNEPHLLTPISGGGSPCIQQTASLPYPSTVAPIHSQASPSSHSRMYWHNSVDMSAPQSQVGSPMAMNPATAESHFEMNYIQAETQINDEIPEPPAVHYFGSYTVSAQPEPEQGSLSPQMPPYYMHQNPHVLNSYPSMVDMPISQLPMEQHNTPASHTPYHAHPQPTMYETENDVIQVRSDSLRRRQYGYALPSTHFSRPEPNRQQNNPLKPSRNLSQGRVQRGARMRRRHSQSLSASDNELVDIAQARPENMLPDEFIIKPDCPAEHRFLFEKHRELAAAGHKGKGMWEPIQKEFNEKFKVESDIPRLQMLVTRGRYRFLEWSQKDQSILYQSMAFFEAQYWKMVLRKFKELGGGQTTAWGMKDIEHRAVELGLVEESYAPLPSDPSLNTRRKKKLSNRLRSGAYDSIELQEAANNGPFAHNPDLRDHVMNDIITYRGEQSEDDEEAAVLDQFHETRLRDRQVEIKYEDEGDKLEKATSKANNKTTKPKKLPAKAKGRGRSAPKSRAA